MNLHLKFVDSIEQVDANNWHNISSTSGPLLKYAFLKAFETSGSIGGQSGWKPKYGLIYHNEKLVALLPCFEKSHSYGEYVFDHAWANAYHQHGIEYYPKLISAIPFTPVTGSRLLISEADKQAYFPTIIELLKEGLGKQNCSSFHWLFVDEETSNQLQSQGFPQRCSVQFQWHNREYKSFDEFLITFNSRKRKNVKKERQKVKQQDVLIHRLTGTQITDYHMSVFYHCYKQTYLKRSGHEGYLTQAFFFTLLESMPENLLLIVAEYDSQPVAAALFLFDEQALYGRYWGALTEIDGLHFEVCYYQGIEFCIEHSIPLFNPGTQGEHKIARGFEPTLCYSNHYLQRPEFHHAVEDFLKRELPYIEHYKNQADSLLPFKQ